jgi:hypothetical protein
MSASTAPSSPPFWWFSVSCCCTRNSRYEATEARSLDQTPPRCRPQGALTQLRWRGLDDREALAILCDAVDLQRGSDDLINRFYTLWFATDISARDLFPPDGGTIAGP